MSAAATDPKPPVAARRPEARELHGRQLVDDYAWLRDENWREVMRDPSRLDSAIRDYLTAENEYTETRLAAVKGLRESLSVELSWKRPKPKKVERAPTLRIGDAEDEGRDPQPIEAKAPTNTSASLLRRRAPEPAPNDPHPRGLG